MSSIPNSDLPTTNLKVITQEQKGILENEQPDIDEVEGDEQEEAEKELAVLREIIPLRPEYLYPVNTPTFAIPEDPDLRVIFDVYKPTPNTCRKFLSEVGRNVYSEAFIENPKLGTLADLCVRVLAKEYGVAFLPALIRDDPLKMRIYYDSLNVDLPLAQCVHIEDVKFWRRVVLSKLNEPTLMFKKLHEYDWRKRGITLKYVEIVESQPAEYWPEQKMNALAEKIKPFITNLKICHLRPLQERAFEQFFESDNEGNSTISSSSLWHSLSSSLPPPEYVSSDIRVEEEQVAEEGELVEDDDEDGAELVEYDSKIEAEFAAIINEREEAKRAIKQAAREQRQRELEMHLKRQKRRARKRLMQQSLLLEEEKSDDVKSTKSKKQAEYKSIFELSVSEDEEAQKEFFFMEENDQRNIEKAVRRRLRFNYAAEHCHHIDLSFVRCLEFLETFHLEFQCPPNEYHEKYYNMSYVDIERLAFGIGQLQNLKVFRLRNSRMDSRKVETLVVVLRSLVSLETIDFGNDQLKDDCGPALYKLFRISKQQCLRLELEGNFFSEGTLTHLADGIRYYRGHIEYLGLARNPISYFGLKLLAEAMIWTGMVSELCLTGIEINQAGVEDIIAGMLLTQHEALLRLNLAAIPIGNEAAKALRKAMEANLQVLEMDVRACGLDLEIESDIEVMLKRNQFIVENPFIGDETKTQADVEEFVSRVKNPILLRVINKIEKRKQCLLQRPSEFIPTSSSFTEEVLETDKEDSLTSLEKLIIKLQKEADKAALNIGAESSKQDDTLSTKQIATEGQVQDASFRESEEKFVYEPNAFDRTDFLRHVKVPGPEKRYSYLKKFRQIDDYKENIVRRHLEQYVPDLARRSAELEKSLLFIEEEL